MIYAVLLQYKIIVIAFLRLRLRFCRQFCIPKKSGLTKKYFSPTRFNCGVEFGIFSVECGVSSFLVCSVFVVWRVLSVSVEYGVWSVECGVWSVQSGVWSVECGVRSVECGVWRVDSGVWGLECGGCCV